MGPKRKKGAVIDSNNKIVPDQPKASKRVKGNMDDDGAKTTQAKPKKARGTKKRTRPSSDEDGQIPGDEPENALLDEVSFSSIAE